VTDQGLLPYDSLALLVAEELLGLERHLRLDPAWTPEGGKTERWVCVYAIEARRVRTTLRLSPRHSCLSRGHDESRM